MKRKGSWKREKKRERSPGTGCGLSGKEEEGSYLFRFFLGAFERASKNRDIATKPKEFDQFV